jgi:hypothetical protein
MNLPNRQNTVVLHYGCADFNKSVHTIFWIGAIYYDNEVKKYFFESGSEESIIEEFKNFLDDHQEKIFVHWSMNSPSFGFTPIQNRYKELTGESISITPRLQIDLSEYLKEKYGIEYVSRQGGRLNNLAKLNGFSGINTDLEVKTHHKGTQRLELTFSIYQAEKQGLLKISDSNYQTNPFPELFVSTDTYHKFIKYTSLHIIDVISDYSYLFKRLKRIKLIHNCTEKEFMLLVFKKMNLINKKAYDQFKVDGRLKSLKNSTTEQRMNNFNNIFLD